MISDGSYCMVFILAYVALLMDHLRNKPTWKKQFQYESFPICVISTKPKRTFCVDIPT